jgi:hypothetical protein
MEQVERERGLMVDTSPIEEYRPSRIEVLQQHEIRIRFLSRGCIVSVGCKDIAFQDLSDAIHEINKYLTCPYETQQEWRKILE